MRASMIAAIAAMLLAGAANAQTDPLASPSTASAPPVTEIPGAAATPPGPVNKPGNTISGVTVTPQKIKPCSERDKDCMALVVAKLKELYPEQLRRWCHNQEDVANRANLQAGDVIMGTQFHGPMERAFDTSQGMKAACDTPAKPKP